MICVGLLESGTQGRKSRERRSNSTTKEVSGTQGKAWYDIKSSSRESQARGRLTCALLPPLYLDKLVEEAVQEENSVVAKRLLLYHLAVRCRGYPW